MASPAAPRLELDRSTSLSSAAMGADKGYDKNKGEDQWPEWPDAQSVGTRAIQFISNHAALEVIVIFAIVINTITLAVQNPGNQFDYTDPWLNPFLDQLDLVLTTVFTIEMFIRIFAMGLSTDTERPYDVLFPGETVQICDPDDNSQTITVNSEDRRVALRVKIMDSSGRERRGWISAEEQEVQLGVHPLGSCCCFGTKKRKMTSVNGLPLLANEVALLDLYDKDDLPKKLIKHCIDPRNQKDKIAATRKQQYAVQKYDPEVEKKPRPQLAFTEVPTESQPKDHLEDIRSRSDEFEPGTKLTIQQHVGVTRGDFGNHLIEANAARNYAKGQPSSPADGKYLRWQWSVEGAESWISFDDKSSQLLTDAKQGAEELADKEGNVHLKESEGFHMSGLADEDYLFNPAQCEVATQWKGVMHKIVNKQTAKRFDIRMIAVDIAYLSDAWNQLDFFVVITSWATVFLEVAEVELPFKTSSLRALRVMRVLRSMRFFSGIKTILSVLGRSFPKMGNIVGFLLFVYCILGIVGVQMFRGRLMYRCSAGFPEPDATGWDYQWMGIGDPNGPSAIFENSPYCYPGDSAASDPPWVNVCEDSCGPDNQTSDLVLPSNDPNMPNTPWQPEEIFHRLDASDADSIGHLTHDEVRAMLAYMGVDAPRQPDDADVDAASIQMRWQAPTCTGTAAEVPRSCTGSSILILEAEKCEGTPNPDVGGVCDLLLNTGNTAVCLDGCELTPAVTPTCDLDPGTQSGTDNWADCPVGCVDAVPIPAGQLTCDFDENTDNLADCPAGCTTTSAQSGEDSSVRITLPLFKQWWAREHPCMPCYEAPSCRSVPDDPDGSRHKCYNFGNPGFGIHGFDHIVMSWHTIFIMMTNLYWWETAHQIEDVQGGLGSAISWLFGLIVVFMLSWVTVNMFVAVICDMFSEVLEDQKKFDEEDEDEEDEEDEGAAEELIVRNQFPAVVSHAITLPKRDEKLNEAEELKMEKQKKDKNSKKIRLKIPGKQNDDGSPWEKEMVLANPRPWYVDATYKPLVDSKGEALVDSEGDGNGSPICPSKMMLNPYFDNIIMCFILANTVTLAMEHTTGPPQHLMSDGLNAVLTNLGHLFNVVFVFEMVVKILGMGYLNYLAVPFNCLDHFIVATSILNYFGDLLPGASAARLLRIFRLFRIAKVVRILYKYQSIKRLLDTVAGAGTMLANLTLFILFVVTVFAIMGMHLMGDNINTCSPRQPSGSLSPCKVDRLSFCEQAIESGTATCTETFCPECPQPHACDKTCGFPCFCELLDEDDSNGELQRRHYENIGKAWLMAFQTLTGDDWCNQMYAYVNIFGWPAAIFYAFVFIFNNYVLMNMFIAVILEGFAIENAQKEEKELSDSRQLRSATITSEMYEPEEAPEQFQRTCCCLPLAKLGIGPANDYALGILHGDRWRYQTEGTDEFPDTIESKNIIRGAASNPAGFKVRVTVRDTESDGPIVDSKSAGRTTYNGWIASEKRWNDHKVFVTKNFSVRGAVQSMKQLIEGVKNTLRTDEEIRAVCNMPVKATLLPWLEGYAGTRTVRPTGYHAPDEPKGMDAATRKLWKNFDLVREENGTLGQLMWAMDYKELTNDSEEKAVALIRTLEKEFSAQASPLSGAGSVRTQADEVVTPDDADAGPPGYPVKLFVFESISLWWFHVDTTAELMNPGGLQAMNITKENEKRNKKLLALRDELESRDADKGQVHEALEECKLHEGHGADALFLETDADNSGYLDRTEISQMFASEGIPLSDEDLTKLLAKIDKNTDVHIEPKEFLDWLRSDDPFAAELRGRKLAHSVWTLPESMDLIKKLGEILKDIDRQELEREDHKKAQEDRPTGAPEPPQSLWTDVLKGYKPLYELLKTTKQKLHLEEPAGRDVVALDIAEEYSHPVRRCAERIALNPWFERTVMIAIIISSVLLAMEGPQGSLRSLERTEQDKDATNDVEALLSVIDTCFYGVFLFEFFVKLIAYGFWNTPDAYIKDSWNKLDFVVVVFSTVNYLPGQSKSSLGRIFRLGRCLRPLRMINKFPSLQVIVAAIVDSLGTNTAVLGLSFMLFLIFGILGVNIFGGKFWHCTDGSVVGSERWNSLVLDGTDAYPVTQFDSVRLSEMGMSTTNLPDTWAELEMYADVDGDKLWDETVDLELFCSSPSGTRECAYPYRNPTDNGHRDSPKILTLVNWDAMNDRVLCEAAGQIWQNKPWHFDNIASAIMGMFTASTLAGWTDLMEMSMDVTDFDQQPVTNASAYFAVYWVLFVFLLAFFITNLFLGVLIDFIGQADGSALTTDDQQEWTDLQRNTKSAKPPVEVLQKPEHPIRLACYNLTADPRKSAAWTMLGNVAIGSNVLVMMLEFEGQSTEWELALDQINLGFLIFFTVDMVLKYVGLGRKMYFLDPWNQFDAIVVSISWIGDIVGFKASVARAFRAFRIALVLKNAKGLQALFRTLINSVKPSVNICALLLLLFSLYSILGMQIFGGAPMYIKLHEFGQVQQNRQSNFHSYFEAMKLLFECSAGKDWKIVMYEVEGETGPTVAFLYFFTFFFFAVYILTNMFVAVIIDEFGACQRESSLSISLDNMIVFQKVWRAHALIHGAPHAIMIKGGKNKVNIRQVLKDVGLFTGQEQQSEKLDREHREEMKKYEEANEISAKQKHFSKAEEILTKLRVVESDLFREGLTRQWDAAVRAKDFAKADDTMQKLLKLDEDIHELKGSNLAPSCELVLKTGGTKEAIISTFVKKADERDLGTHREIIKKQDQISRSQGLRPREFVQGVNVTPNELKKFDSGDLVPHPEWLNEDKTDEEEDMPAVRSWKPGEVHPLWEDWFRGVQLELQERERLHSTFQDSFGTRLKKALCGIMGEDNDDRLEEDVEVHYLAVLEAVLLQSMRKAGNDNPDKKKKMEQLKFRTQKDVKLVKQFMKAILDPFSGVPGQCSELKIRSVSAVSPPSLITDQVVPDTSPGLQLSPEILPGSTNHSPQRPTKVHMPMPTSERGVKVVVWEVGKSCEKHLNDVSRKPEYRDDPDNKGRKEAATFAASESWQKRGIKIRAKPMDAAIDAAIEILSRKPDSLERPNFAKELTERGTTRIPGAPEDGCHHKALRVSTSVGTRMVLAIQRTPVDELDKSAKWVNLADQCMYWCEEKLPMHFVPAAAVIVEDDSIGEPLKLETVSAGDLNKLFHNPEYKYPWEMHSLLSARGWHLREADSTTESDNFDYLDEDEVLILKEAWNMFDPFYREAVGASGEKLVKCRQQTGYLFTSEVLIALKLSELYELPKEGTDEAKEWEDRIWQPRGDRVKEKRQSDNYEAEDKDHDRMEYGPCHLGDIDRDMHGTVAIGWPEFLAIVGALKNEKKCRGGKPGLKQKSIRKDPEK